jgi:hypothetical protein
MPNLEENKRVWDEDYDWSQSGDEWSSAWGGVDMQWYCTLLPRLHTFIPTGTILEIAPGFGRWTQFLADSCQTLYLVDLSEKCIEACRERFGRYSHIHYHVNDGKSLDVVPDDSIDLAFSFDSLVHAGDDVIRTYLEQLAHKLTRDGVGFFHHSNMAEHVQYVNRVRRLPARLVFHLHRLGLVERLDTRWRDYNMSAALFARLAEQVGLRCVTQELINWGSRRLIDCISVFTRRGSKWDRQPIVRCNREFMDEARYAIRLSELYRR